MNEIEILRERVEYLEEENRQLREALSPSDNPFLGKFGLTRWEATILQGVCRMELATYEYLDAVADTVGFEGRDTSSGLAANRIKVGICKVRKKIPKRIEIKTAHSVGYMIEPEHKRELLKLAGVQ